jgi:hypothetical protein
MLIPKLTDRSQVPHSHRAPQAMRVVAHRLRRDRCGAMCEHGSYERRKFAQANS